MRWIALLFLVVLILFFTTGCAQIQNCAICKTMGGWFKGAPSAEPAAPTKPDVVKPAPDKPIPPPMENPSKLPPVAKPIKMDLPPAAPTPPTAPPTEKPVAPAVEKPTTPTEKWIAPAAEKPITPAAEKSAVLVSPAEKPAAPASVPGGTGSAWWVTHLRSNAWSYLIIGITVVLIGFGVSVWFVWYRKKPLPAPETPK